MRPALPPEPAAGGRGGRARTRGEPPAAGAPGAAPAPGVPNMNKVTPEGGRFWDAEHRYSCAAPPWGELIAVNANTGDIAWRVPLGEFPELAAKGIKTGTADARRRHHDGREPGLHRRDDRRILPRDRRAERQRAVARKARRARALDSLHLHGKDGKQYVAVPAGGGGFLRSPTSDTVIAFALPDGK